MKKNLSANTLKLIAVAAMLIDHIAFGFVPESTPIYFLMRLIGRITAPVMCFFVAEGFYHTHNLKKYMLRLALFAVISHFPYRLYFGIMNPLSSSIMLPLFMGLCALWFYNNVNIQKWLRYLGCALCMLVSYFSDWSCLPVFFILLFGIYHNDAQQLVRFAVVCAILSVTAIALTPKESYMVGVFLSLPLLYLYSGQLGKKIKALKWGFYIFYPLHLLLLYAIKLAVI